MNPLQNLRVLVLDQQSETNGGTITFSNIDTKGANCVKLLVLATTAATDKRPTTLKISEGDDTTTSKTDIVAFTGGTQTSSTVGFVIPAPEGTQSDSTYQAYAEFNIDTRGRKRYLTLTVVPTTTQTYRVIGLSSLGIAPVGAGTADQNSRVVVNG